MITIKFKKVRWAPYSKYGGYDSGRIQKIHFDSKKECDEWVDYNNDLYQGCIQYISLPYITDHDVKEAEIIED